MSPASMEPAGGSGQITISTNRECTWDARSEADWISLVAPTSGQGEGTLGYRASANGSVSTRRGAVVVNDRRVEVVQGAGSCRFDLSALAGSAPGEGGSLSVSITAQASCVWTAVSQVDWIRVEGTREGNGSGAVTLTVAANAGAARQGRVVIAGQDYVVSQAAGGPAGACGFTVTPPSHSFGPSGGEGVATVTARQANCAWTVATDAPWVTVIAGSGSGSGTARFVVAPNPGGARNAVVVIAGVPVSVSQTASQVAGCEFATAPASQDVGAGGGDGSVRVTATGSNCVWGAVANVPWITMETGSGSGTGDARYVVAANTGGARTGTIAVAGHTFTVTQAAASPPPPPPTCEVTAAPTAESVGPNGGEGTVQVTAASSNCTWNATSNAAWITVAPGSGSGSGSVRYTVRANSGPARTGTLTVAGTTVTITQASTPSAPACEVSAAPNAEAFGGNGGEATVRVTASASNCTWSAASNVGWVTVQTASGSGSADVRYVVAPNTGPARSGTLVVAGVTVTVTQAAAPPPPACEVSAAPTSASVGPGAATGSVQVTTSAPNCTWTATSGVPWITVGTGAGSGSGSVPYTVAANTGPARTGTLVVAGTTVTITQAAASAPACEFTVSPTTQAIGVAGGTGSATVTATASTCAWPATSNASWIVLTGGGGTGNGAVSYVVAPNLGPARTGTLTVAGATVTVNQAGVSQPIELRGDVSNLSGTCPATTFTLGGRTVRTNAETVFERGCDRLRNRRDFIVSGVEQPDMTVLALNISEGA